MSPVRHGAARQCRPSDEGMVPFVVRNPGAWCGLCRSELACGHIARLTLTNHRLEELEAATGVLPLLPTHRASSGTDA